MFINRIISFELGVISTYQQSLLLLLLFIYIYIRLRALNKKRFAGRIRLHES